MNLALAVLGVEVAVIFVEQAEGGHKISFRSRTSKVDCNALGQNVRRRRASRGGRRVS